MSEVAFKPIGPGLFVRLVMRPLANRLNPTLRSTAGTSGVRAARVEHVGRRSGKVHLTPVRASRDGDTIVIPLAFGNTTDWVRNVLAAGRCVVRMEGEELLAVDPECVALSDVRPLLRRVFKPNERAFLRVMDVKQIMRLRVARA